MFRHLTLTTTFRRRASCCPASDRAPVSVEGAAALANTLMSTEIAQREETGCSSTLPVKLGYHEACRGSCVPSEIFPVKSGYDESHRYFCVPGEMHPVKSGYDDACKYYPARSVLYPGTPTELPGARNA